MSWLGNLTERAGKIRKRAEDEFWHLFLVLMLAAGIAVLSLWAGTTQGPSWEWAKAVGLAMLVVFLAWAAGYFPMLNSERKRRIEAEEASARERKRADEAQRRADEAKQRADDFFPRMMVLLEQIAANTAPNRPGQPDQLAPEPDGESVRLDD